MHSAVGAALATVAVASAGLGYSLAEARSFRLRRVDVPVLPTGSAPMRVLHVSDLHLTPRSRAEIAWVRGLADLEPDMVVDTGDNLAHIDAVPAALHALQPLLALPGAFVLGSNDYWGPTPRNPLRYLWRHTGDERPAGRRLPTSRLVAGLREAGWADLTNTTAALEVAGLRVSMTGVDDPHLNLDRYAGPPPPSDLRLGVAHAPYRRVLDAMAPDTDLMLAGHTHGGQVCLPGYGALTTNCDLDRRRARGLSSHAGTPLHVSAGLGTSPFAPIRFACPPEATLLTLRARQAVGTA